MTYELISYCIVIEYNILYIEYTLSTYVFIVYTMYIVMR